MVKLHIKIIFSCCWLLAVLGGRVSAVGDKPDEGQHGMYPDLGDLSAARAGHQNSQSPPTTGFNPNPNVGGSSVPKPNFPFIDEQSAGNPSASLPQTDLSQTSPHLNLMDMPIGTTANKWHRRPTSSVSSGLYPKVDDPSIPCYSHMMPSAAVEPPPPSEFSQQHQVPGSSSSSSFSAAAHQVPGPSLFEQYAHMAPPLNHHLSTTAGMGAIQQKNDITNDRLFNGAATYPAPPNMNVYPLSYAQQITRRITQEAMKARITAQMEALHVDQNGTGQLFHPELHTVVINNKSLWPTLFIQSTITVKPWSTILKETLESAIKGNIRNDADSTDLIEVLDTTTNGQKAEMGLAQNHKQMGPNSSYLCNRICAHPELAKSRRYQTVVWHLCNDPRDESFAHGVSSAKEMARKLDDYLLRNDSNLDAEEISQILARTNYSQLRLIFQQTPNQYTFSSRLDTLGNGGSHFLQVIKAIHTDVHVGRPTFYAHLLKEKLEKIYKSILTYNADAHRDIARILVTRAQIDLPDIMDAFGYFFYGRRGESVQGLPQALEIVKKKTPVWMQEQKKQLTAYIQITELVKSWATNPAHY